MKLTSITGLLVLGLCWTGLAPAATPATKPGAARATAAPRTIKDEQTGFSYRVEAAPAWVVPAQERPGVSTDRAAMHYRVIDDQFRIDERGAVQAYSHVVRVVDDGAGLATAAQLEVDFDPAYQSLSIHHIDIVRQGQHLSRLDPKRVHLLRRETQLERQMIDGRVTWNLNLDDVRQGDEVDFAYTVYGANPIFGPRLLQQAWQAAWRGPAALHQVRVLAPAQRTVAYKIGPADTQLSQNVKDGWRETVLRRESVAQLGFDDGAPYAEMLPFQTQFSEFADWGSVAQWGAALFVHPEAQPLLTKKAQEIRAAHSSVEARVLAALDFVQRDIRYFGTEIGINSHRPAAPDRVIEQRYGDCKDKTGLLVALLRQLDVSAAPVLVSANLRRDVERLLPSPQAFDHVIAKVELNGQTLWLDATRNHQTGPLEQRQANLFQRGLVLAPDTTALATLPTPYDVRRVLARDVIRFQRIADDPTLESRITYRAEHADAWREALATRGLADLANALAEPYAKAYPKLVPVGEPKVETASDDDAITVVQQFRLPEFWRFQDQRVLAGDIVQWAAIQPLVFPRSATRRHALAPSLPGVYRHEVDVEFPEEVYRQASQSRFEDSVEGLRVLVTMDSTRQRVHWVGESRLGTDRIEASAWPNLVARMSKMLPKLGSTVAISPLSASQQTALQDRARELDEAIRQQRVKVVTRTQNEAQFRQLVLNAQIDGGRLPPQVLAQALKERGIQRDNLGQEALASADFQQAMKLTPQQPDILNAAAVNALALGRLDDALSWTAQVLTLAPRDPEALNLRSRVLYLQGDAKGAVQLLEPMLNDGQGLREGYPLVWWSMAQRQLGQDVRAASARFAKDQWPTEWPRPLMDFAVGQINAGELIRAAKSQKTPIESLTEAYFYIGEAYRADGQQDKAIDAWKHATDQGVVEFVEDQVARLRLKTAR